MQSTEDYGVNFAVG